MRNGWMYTRYPSRGGRPPYRNAGFYRLGRFKRREVGSGFNSERRISPCGNYHLQPRHDPYPAARKLKPNQARFRPAEPTSTWHWSSAVARRDRISKPNLCLRNGLFRLACIIHPHDGLPSFRAHSSPTSALPGSNGAASLGLSRAPDTSFRSFDFLDLR